MNIPNIFLSLSLKIGLLSTRFVMRQEAAKRLQQEPVLNPTSVTPKAPLPVKDLTMSLMENNLKQISLTPAPTPVPAQGWSMPPAVAPIAAPIAPAAPVAPVNAWTNQNWRPPPAAAPAWQTSPTAQFLPAFPAPQFQLANNKVPMNSIVTQPSFPTTMMNGMKPSQPAKQLSATEINDFLS